MSPRCRGQRGVRELRSWRQMLPAVESVRASPAATRSIDTVGRCRVHRQGVARHDGQRLGELKLPVLFLAGRHDEAAPETVADFQRRVPGARMMVLENSAHSTYRTETAEYVKIVRQFLEDAEERKEPM